jgi:hypothetical protein
MKQNSKILFTKKLQPFRKLGREIKLGINVVNS